MRLTSRGRIEHPWQTAGGMRGERDAGAVQQEMPEPDLGQCWCNAQAVCHKAFLILAVLRIHFVPGVGPDSSPESSESEAERVAGVASSSS